MKWLILISTFILYPACFAQDSFDELIEEIAPKLSFSNEQLKHLEQELKVNKMIIEEVQNLRMSGVKLENLTTDKSVNKIQQMLLNSIHATQIDLTDDIKQVLSEGINQKNLKKSLGDFKTFLQEKLTNKKASAASVIRRFGMDTGLVYLAAMQIDYTFPLIMIANGQPAYGTLLTLPVSSVTTASYIATKKAIKFKQITKSFGGVNKYIDFYKQFRKVKKFFHESILSKRTIIDLSLPNKSYVFTIEKENFLSRFLSKQGWNKKLNYTSLVNFLEKNSLLEDFLPAVKMTTKPDHIKFIRILNRIELTADESIIIKLKQKFGKYIKEVDSFNDYPAFKKWAISIAHSGSMDSFVRKLSHLPDHIPPKVFDRIWRGYIIPTSSKSIKPYMDKNIRLAFNSMINDYEKKLFAKLATSLDQKIDGHIKGQLIDYFFNTFKLFNICSELYKQPNTPKSLIYTY
ncbi:MAG: hypothetical protein N4A33_11855 [Bacteriovoracaceae bacterium]|nr:hypothetical protein [Bacteriovoracaceae bacterium]